MAITVSTLLAGKGRDVTTIAPTEPLLVAAQLLSEQRFGALVVSADGKAVDGILSERDIVRQLAAVGAASLGQPVAEVMTSTVTTCALGTSVDELMAIMTGQRIRHVPVLDRGSLVGIISIGDVVKSRLDELEVRAETMEQYVTGSAG